MQKISIRDLCEITIIAALYVALTVGLTPLSYGSVQFRLSEALMLLVLYKRKYAISMVLGCFVANLFSPVGWVDIIFGTLATVVAIIPMLFIKNMEISSLFPTIANGIIVGLELSIVYELPIALTMAQVAAGEFVVVTLVGIPLFRSLDKNEGFLRAIRSESIAKPNKYLSSSAMLGFALLIVSIIMYFKLSMREVVIDEFTSDYYTLFFRMKTDSYYIGLILLILPFVAFLSTILLNKKLGLAVDSILALVFLGFFIYIAASYNYDTEYTFYLYLLYPVLAIVVAFLKYRVFSKEENSEIEA